jgi:hypothetical protein
MPLTLPGCPTSTLVSDVRWISVIATETSSVPMAVSAAHDPVLMFLKDRNGLIIQAYGDVEPPSLP